MGNKVKAILEDNKPVTMTLKNLSRRTHELLKVHQRQLMGQRADKVNLQEAYVDALDQFTKKYETN